MGVPLAQLDRFLSEVPGVVRGAGAERAILFGHLGDGNVHVNVLGADPDDSRSDDAVLELVLECGGTISAEHGVGVSKARWLERARGRRRGRGDAGDQARARPREPPEPRRRPIALIAHTIRGSRAAPPPIAT